MVSSTHLFCTYLDSNYLDRGLCLWDSLKRHHKSAQLLVCCLDKISFDVLSQMQIAGLRPIMLDELEQKFTDLITAKSSRSKVEYYFTITPSLIRYTLESSPLIEIVTYLDSDLFFYSDPQPLFDEFSAKAGQVAIIAHRFPDRLSHLAIYGTYNVGWVTFRKSQTALTCLYEWQRNCIDWCHDHVDGDRFADQKYLDAWPSTYDGIVVLTHAGANVALWNVESGPIERRKRQINVSGQKLIFYHFHGLSQINRRIFFTSCRMYGMALNAIVRHRIYGPYMASLRKMQSKLRRSKIYPLRRYKHSAADVAYAKRSPLDGVFLYSICGISLP